MRLNPEWAVGIAASIAAMCPKVAYELYLVPPNLPKFPGLKHFQFYERESA